MLNWVNNRIKMEKERSTKVKKCKDFPQMLSSTKFASIYFGETYENMYKNIHLQLPDPAG